MANIPLKSIKFPGLADTYIVPQIDSTLAVTGKAADAKVTGDRIRETMLVASEVEDIRIGVDGTIYRNAGDAVREQIANASKMQRVKSPLTKVYFNYNGCVIDSTLSDDENARMLATYDVGVFDGALNVQASRSEQSGRMLRECNIINLTKKINKNFRFFLYITANGTHIDEQGVWDGTGARHYNFEQLKQYMRDLSHAGGYQDENNQWTGGIQADGVFFDEFGAAGSLTELQNQGGWNSTMERHNALVDFAHSINLSVFANTWEIEQTLSGQQTTGIFNPEGLTTHLNANDFMLVESYEWYPGTNDDTTTLYWPALTSGNKMVNCRTLYYTEGQSPKLCSFMLGGRNWTEEMKRRALTWAIYNGICTGANALYCGGFKTYDWPEDIEQFVLEENALPQIQRIGEGGYKYVANGHELITKRWATGEITMKSLMKLSITVDNETFHDAFVEPRTFAYDTYERMENIEDEIYDLNHSDKKMANPYVRLFIDDWVPVPHISDYTNLFPKTAIQHQVSKTNVDNDYYSFRATSLVASNWGVLRMEVADPNLYAGKTLEFGLTNIKTSETPPRMLVQAQVRSSSGNASYTFLNWVQSETTVHNQSRVNNDTGLCFVFTVPDDVTRIFFHVECRGSAENVYVDIENLYLVDTAEIKEFNSKDSFTNMVRPASNWSDRMSWIPGTKPYTMVVNPDGDDNHSFRITYNETNYQAWEGVVIPIDTTNLFKAGSRWELGCLGFESNAGNKICFRIYTNRDGFYPWVTPSTRGESAITKKEARCIPIVISELKTDAVTSAYIEIVNLSSVPYNEDANENKTYHSAKIKGLYLYNPDEEDVKIRGITPANTWLQIARVTEEMLAEDTKLQSNALYITDAGNLFITDFSGNRIDLIRNQ